MHEFRCPDGEQFFNNNTNTHTSLSSRYHAIYPTTAPLTHILSTNKKEKHNTKDTILYKMQKMTTNFRSLKRKQSSTKLHQSLDSTLKNENRKHKIKIRNVFENG